MPGSEAAPRPLPRSPDSFGEGRLDVILVIVLLLGLWLRWSLNGTWRLGPDESLYGFWARQVATGKDIRLAATPGVDKPPLFIYAVAASMQIYGFTEFATRFPNIVASTLSIALTYMLARHLYRTTQRRSIARLAAVLMALSPFAVLYAPTAFTDPLMVLWLLLSAVLACRGSWGFAGAAAGLAVLTKQEALVLVPAVWIVGMRGMVSPAALMNVPTNTGHAMRAVIRERLPGQMRFLMACVLVAVTGLLAWQWGRPAQPDPFKRPFH